MKRLLSIMLALMMVLGMTALPAQAMTQQEMLERKNIADAFNKSKIAVFEAGTGVGKSYAYLIPSMMWAVKNKERVIVSTGTINLQQQLIEKDIPAAEKILGINVPRVTELSASLIREKLYDGEVTLTVDDAEKMVRRILE